MKWLMNLLCLWPHLVHFRWEQPNTTHPSLGHDGRWNTKPPLSYNCRRNFQSWYSHPPLQMKFGIPSIQPNLQLFTILTTCSSLLPHMTLDMPPTLPHIWHFIVHPPSQQTLHLVQILMVKKEVSLKHDTVTHPHSQRTWHKHLVTNPPSQWSRDMLANLPTQ